MSKRLSDPVSRARVLVVEDENIIAKDIEQTLTSLGYQVCAVVDTGDEAIRRSLADKPDLILMDVRIRGEMDGIQAAARIREQLMVPVVFLTAFADEATLQRAKEVAPYGYVLKPFDDRDLQVAAIMALAKHQAFAELDQRVRQRTDELLRTEARVRQMSAVAELGVFALGAQELQAVLDSAMRTVCETLGTPCSCVLELAPDQKAFTLRAARGGAETFMEGEALAAGAQSQAGYTLLTAEPVICEDYLAERRFQVPAAVRAQGLTGGVTVVIFSRLEPRPFGILGAYTRTRRPFAGHDVAFLQTVATLIATTIDRVRVDERRLAAERNAENEKVNAEQAAAALRIRDEFLSIASHELRTPLTSLQLQLGSLARGSEALGERVASKLERASRSTERLRSLVESLLDVSRLSTGRLELRREPVTLDEMVREVVDALAEDARQSGSELRLIQNSGSLVGHWDRLRIEQVISNLVTNACKHGGPRPIEVHIDRVGDQAEIRVKDEGPGIEPEDLERIFQRFERATSSRHHGGLGLGLYISRQIVEEHGGTLSVESASGQGSTFIVLLPLETASTEQPSERAVS